MLDLPTYKRLKHGKLIAKVAEEISWTKNLGRSNRSCKIQKYQYTLSYKGKGRTLTLKAVTLME